MGDVSSGNTMIESLQRGSAVACLLVASVIAQFATDCLAAAGDMDTTFGNQGVYAYPRPDPSPSFPITFNTRQVVPMSGGRLLALSGIQSCLLSSCRYGSSATFALAANGRLDPRYGTGGMLAEASIQAHRFMSARELADGSVILVSEVNVCGLSEVSDCFNTEDTGPTYLVQRYLPNGTLDASYGMDGTNFTASHVGNAAVLADGTTISLGATYHYWLSAAPHPARPYAFDAVVVDANGRNDTALAARFLAQMILCNASGTAIPSSDVGSLTSANVTAPVVEVTPQDQIIFAHNSCILRLNRDGNLDTTFGTGGLSKIDNPDRLPTTRVLILKDGGMVIFSILADASSYRVIKLLPDGLLDLSFNGTGRMEKLELPFQLTQTFRLTQANQARDDPHLYYQSVPNSRGLPALDSHDRVLIAGSVGVVPGTDRTVNYLARFDDHMRVDKSFGDPATGLALIGDPALGSFIPASAATDNLGRIILGGRLRRADCPATECGFAEAVARMQSDSAAPESSTSAPRLAQPALF